MAGTLTAHEVITVSGRRVIHLSASPISPRARAAFWAKVDCSGGMLGCHPWLGAIDKAGYGRYGDGKSLGTNMAHRIAWTLTYGPIPEGMDIDHVRERGCVNRHCVNVLHMEVVTHYENCRRGSQAQQTHCKNGHPFDSENLIMRFRRDGITPYRQCKTCVRIRGRRPTQTAGVSAPATDGKTQEV